MMKIKPVLLKKNSELFKEPGICPEKLAAACPDELAPACPEELAAPCPEEPSISSDSGRKYGVVSSISSQINSFKV